MRYVKYVVCVLLVGFWVFIAAIPVSAHRDGCHRWHSCPSDSGSYVCGDLGYYSECPGANPTPAPTIVATPAPTPAPRPVPVVTTKTVAEDAPIQFAVRIKKNYKEYAPYKKNVQAGKTGLKRVYREITYTDGVETSRKVTKDEVVTPAVDDVTEVGARSKPTAKLSAFTKTTKADKYDIKGTYKAGSTVVLSLDGKRIKRAKTDGKGNFIFKQIKITSKTPRIAIYNRVGSKEIQVSETNIVNTAKQTLVTEYDSLHRN